MPPQHKCAFVEGGQQKLSELTGLTAARATECLAENSNDLVTALASFVQNFKTLSADYFADANKAKSTAADINTMVGLAYDAVSAVMEAERLDEAEEPKCWKALAAAKWDVKKACADLASHAAPVAAPTTGASMENRYTGSFMTMPRFQQAEIVARATIFNMDKGFMASTNEAQLRERMLKWVEAVPAFRRVPLKYPPIPNYDENTVRVIVRDAERTFFDPEHRRKFHEFLHAMWKDLGTYGQAMSYLAAVCLLALTEEETSFILRKVALDYIPGHWKTEADGFATNAWVIEHFFQEKFPDVAAHFKKFHFTPEMYMQKILSGLCVHVLPFKYMFQFLDNFLVKGFEYLVRFELAVVQHLKPKLLAINDPQKVHELFELMRLDINTIDLADIEAILAGAAAMQVDMTDVDVLRSRMYDEKVLPKLEAAKAAPPEFDPCSVCDKEEPTLFCDDCEIPICASCAKKAPHNTHSHSEY